MTRTAETLYHLELGYLPSKNVFIAKCVEKPGILCRATDACDAIEGVKKDLLSKIKFFSNAPQRDISTARMTKTDRPSSLFSCRDEIVRMYAAGESIATITRAYSAGEMRIVRLLKRAGVKLRDASDRARVANALRIKEPRATLGDKTAAFVIHAYKSGERAPVIAQKCGVRVESLHRFLDAHKVTKRTLREAYLCFAKTKAKKEKKVPSEIKGIKLDTIVKLHAQGLSTAQIGRAIDVAYSTLQAFMEKHKLKSNFKKKRLVSANQPKPQNRHNFILPNSVCPEKESSCSC